MERRRPQPSPAGTPTSPGPENQQTGFRLPVPGNGDTPCTVQLVTLRVGQSLPILASSTAKGLPQCWCQGLLTSTFINSPGMFPPGWNLCTHTWLSKKTVVTPPKVWSSGHFCKLMAKVDFPGSGASPLRTSVTGLTSLASLPLAWRPWP